MKYIFSKIGEEALWLLSSNAEHETSLVKFFQQYPLVGIDLERDKGTGREIDSCILSEMILSESGFTELKDFQD